MSLVKTSISIPEDVLSQAKEASDNFSSLVIQALKDHVRKKAVKKAINSFGKWERGMRNVKNRDLTPFVSSRKDCQISRCDPLCFCFLLPF